MSRASRRRAKKSLGQHFLVDPNLQRKIVGALDPRPDDHLLEIGPGTGALTQHLAGRVRQLILVELDDHFALELRERYEARPDVQVIHGDVLALRLDELAGGGPLKIVGNIPYNITTPLIFHLLERRPRPRVVVLTVQREIAERLSAEPGTKEYGALSVGVQAVTRVERLFSISRNAFRPRPEVDSAVVRLRPFDPAPLTPAEEEALRVLTRAAFSRRRKQLQKVLRQAPEFGLDLETVDSLLISLEIDPSIRPDGLAVADFIKLAGLLHKRG